MRLTRRASLMMPLLAMPAVRPAWGQAWPSRTVRIIVAYPPGGATDIVARKVAEAIAPTLGQPVIVENRPGGSGTIGTGEVVRAQPDGHTLLAMDSSYSMLPYVFARLPWDHARDLLPVTVCNFAPVVLAVKANARWPDLAALLAEARANPTRITYGTGGVGSSLHFAGEDFQHAAGIELYHIPFKGAGEATLGLLSGTVDMVMGSTPSAMANLRAGTIRALAVCGRQRVAALPDVPTFAEAGLPGFQMINWTGLAAPKGTPEASIARLQAAVRDALAAERMQQFFLAQGATTGGMPPEEFGRLIRDEVAQWRGVAERAKLVPQ
jgi:tripartite-type tricarboxylate transporter receptor subunit TctC